MAKKRIILQPVEENFEPLQQWVFLLIQKVLMDELKLSPTQKARLYQTMKGTRND